MSLVQTHTNHAVHQALHCIQLNASSDRDLVQYSSLKGNKLLSVQLSSPAVVEMIFTMYYILNSVLQYTLLTFSLFFFPRLNVTYIKVFLWRSSW